MIDIIKLFLATCVCSLLAYLQPVYDELFVLLFVFFSDMFLAILTDLTVNRNSFKPKKFLTAFFYLAVYLGIVASVFIIGERMGDEQEALFVDKMITYVFIYFYSINIFKNLRMLIPNSKAIEFLDFTFGLEFTKRTPNLDEWMRREKKDDPQKENH